MCSVCFLYLQGHSLVSYAALAAVCVLAPLSFWKYTRSATGQLRWDGACWAWQGFDDVPVRALRVALDFQGFMLVQLFADDGRSAWLFLQQGAGSAQWAALRRALFTRHSPAPDSKPIPDGVWR